MRVRVVGQEDFFGCIGMRAGERVGEDFGRVGGRGDGEFFVCRGLVSDGGGGVGGE